MKQDNERTGAVGEQAAGEFLTEKDYRILVRNFRTRFGEIDIFAKEKQKGATLPKIVFVEGRW